MLARIRAIPAVGRGGAREIGPGGAPGLAAILREIDQTVLARRLTFANGRNGSVALLAYRRRLLRIEGVSPDGLAGEAGEISGIVLTGADDSTVARLGDLLRAFADGAAQISVLTAAPEEDAPGQANGVSAEALAAAWGVDLYGAAGPGGAVSVTGFLERCGPLATAAMLFSGGTLRDSRGSEDDLAALQPVAGLRAGSVPLPGAQPRGGRYFTLLRRGAGDGRLLVLAGQGDETVLILAPAAHLSGIVACWAGRETVGIPGRAPAAP